MNKLVDGAHAPKDHPVSHDDMSCHLRIIAKDTVIPDNTSCAIGYRPGSCSYYHFSRPAIPGAPVNRYEFTDGGIVAYFYGSLFSVKLRS